MQIPAINVNSEIGKLKKAMLHRPGKELENLMPEYLDRLLFDDIPVRKKNTTALPIFCGKMM